MIFFRCCKINRGKQIKKLVDKIRIHYYISANNEMKEMLCKQL